MIDWKKKIQKGGLAIDLQGLPYYTIKFGSKSKVETIYGVDCILPEEPLDEQCANFGLSEYDQIFRTTHIPDQVKFPDKDFGRDSWSEKEIESFVDAEFNRRFNGLWMFIKGIKTYIPGVLYYKMNYWTPITSEKFQYRESDRQLFTFVLFATHDPKCRGIADFKCRQLGDTESLGICYPYERGSRIRGSLHTFQSAINEDHIIETYERLVHGHANMMWYFKPMNRGTENPKKGLILSYPSKHVTHAGIQKQQESGNTINKSSLEDYEFPPLGSRFKYGPSKITRFDGSTGICTAYLDEFGKAKDMNPIEWIQTMAEATFSNIRGIKRGMMILTSTVEDQTEDSLEWAQTIYKESDPKNKLKSGATINGLWHIFRGVAERGFDTIVADRWGFIDKELVIAAVTEKYNAMIAAGNTAGAMSFLRKNPRTIEDVFMSVRNSSPFHVENLKKREFYLSEVVHPKPFTRGNLRWKDGVKDTTVIWEVNPQGKWVISKHPHDFNLESNKRSNAFVSKPGNTNYFCAGIDPIDQNETLASESERSKGAIVLMRKFDENVDSEKSLYWDFNDDVQGIVKGNPVDLGGNHQTNRVCCTYMQRPKDPSEFFEDVILTMVYYGSDFLPEKNKYGGLRTFLKMRGYTGYEMDKPTDVKNYKGQTEKGGVTATENSISMYFDFITEYTCNWANAIDHPELIAQLIKMNWQNRGSLDLGVALGWCLYAGKQRRPRWHGDKQERKIVHFEEHVV